MRSLLLIFAVCFFASAALADPPNPEYAKKAAAATAAANATAAAEHSKPITPGPDDGKVETVPPPDLPLAASKPAAEKAPARQANGAAAQPVHLSDEDKADVKRIEDYLNNLKSISADFLQVDDQGGMTRGSIDIKRPGKMRVTYAPPSHDFIIADGDFVHIWDGSLKSQTNVPEDSSLANFILRDPIKLSGEVTVTKFEKFPAKLELTLEQTNDPGSGQLTLVFEDKPLLLRQWKVLDTQGRTTGVNLENERSGVSFASDTFNFVPPNFGKNEKAN